MARTFAEDFGKSNILKGLLSRYWNIARTTLKNRKPRRPRKPRKHKKNKHRKYGKDLYNIRKEAMAQTPAENFKKLKMLIPAFKVAGIEIWMLRVLVKMPIVV